MREHAQRHYDTLTDGGWEPEQAIRMVNLWVILQKVKGNRTWSAVAADLDMKRSQLSLYVNLKTPVKRFTFDKVAWLYSKGGKRLNNEVAWWEPLWGPMWEVLR